MTCIHFLISSEWSTRSLLSKIIPKLSNSPKKSFSAKLKLNPSLWTLRNNNYCQIKKITSHWTLKIKTILLLKYHLDIMKKSSNWKRTSASYIRSFMRSRKNQKNKLSNIMWALNPLYKGRMLWNSSIKFTTHGVYVLRLFLKSICWRGNMWK